MSEAHTGEPIWDLDIPSMDASALEESEPCASHELPETTTLTRRSLLIAGGAVSASLVAVGTSRVFRAQQSITQEHLEPQSQRPETAVAMGSQQEAEQAERTDPNSARAQMNQLIFMDQEDISNGSLADTFLRLNADRLLQSTSITFIESHEYHPDSSNYLSYRNAQRSKYTAAENMLLALERDCDVPSLTQMANITFWSHPGGAPIWRPHRSEVTGRTIGIEPFRHHENGNAIFVHDPLIFFNQAGNEDRIDAMQVQTRKMLTDMGYATFPMST